MTNQAVQGYAETEQLVGGVETLFKGNAEMIRDFANQAYQTSGLSANAYMETVTSFSASLIQSLGGDTEKAASVADQAIRDMSDNANKMGTDITMIQNAYQGFAKQNFTMLDNLKLGYGGTKEEMQRLLEDAEKISGIEYDISSFADITAAIHVMQEEMGIAGATAAEASTTIQGSVSSMKAAWQNLTVGFADENANIDVLLDNFLDSVETVADNVLPVVVRVLENIFGTLQERGPDMVEAGAELLGKLAAGAVQAIPGIVASIPLIIKAMVGGFKEAMPQFKEIGSDIIEGLWAGIQSLAGWLKTKVSNFVGGIVSNVKGVLGIHSPSRVFGEIGENMALGLGEGWDHEYDTVKKQVVSGLDFGSTTIGYENSGISRSVVASRAGNGAAGPITIVVQSVLDGKIIGETAYNYNIEKMAMEGG